MKKKKNLWLAAFMMMSFATGLVSCDKLFGEDEEEETGCLNFTDKNLNDIYTYADGDTIDIEFEAKAAWTVELNNLTGSLGSWIEKDKRFGEAGQAVLQIIVKPNYTRKMREAELIFTCEDETKLIPIQQTDCTAEGEYPLFHKKISNIHMSPVEGNDGGERNISFGYDAQGRLAGMEYKDMSGTYNVDYTYTENTMILEYSVSGEGSVKMTYELDDRGYVVRSSEPKATFEYDNDGHLMKIVYNEDNSDIYEHYIDFEWDLGRRRLSGYTEYIRMLDTDRLNYGRVESEEWTRCRMNYLSQITEDRDMIQNFYTVNLMSLLYDIEGIVPADAYRYGVRTDEIPMSVRIEYEKRYANGDWILSTDNPDLAANDDNYTSSWADSFGGGIETVFGADGELHSFAMYGQKLAWDYKSGHSKYEITYEKK